MQRERERQGEKQREGESACSGAWLYVLVYLSIAHVGLLGSLIGSLHLWSSEREHVGHGSPSCTDATPDIEDLDYLNRNDAADDDEDDYVVDDVDDGGVTCRSRHEKPQERS